MGKLDDGDGRHRLIWWPYGLEGVVKDLNGSVQALAPEEIEGLREGNRQVDEVMR